MKKAVIFILACALLLQLALICNCTHGFPRQKRGVLDMVATLWCYRERLKVPLFGINLYGCYCGTGGSGVAVDAVDRCCFLHDCCYYHSRVSLKCHSKVKWQLYHYSCDGSQTRCTSSGVCGRMACECDKQFAECLTRARPRRKHFFYNRRDLCPGIKDTCPAGFPNVTEILHWTHNPSHSQVMVTGPSENQEDHRKVKTNEQDKPGTEGQGF